MAAIAGDLTKAVLGHSDADKAFRPWWDNLEDGVLYTFVIMGRYITPRFAFACTTKVNLGFVNLISDVKTYNIIYFCF